MKVKSLEELKALINQNIAELQEYASDDDYSPLEQHDCNVAIETYQYILDAME